MKIAAKSGLAVRPTIASFCFVATCAVFGAGCSSNADTSDSSVVNANQVRASTSTKQAFGVDSWSVESHDDDSVVEGFDEKGAVRVRFAQTVTKDAASVTHGEVAANIDGAPKFQYVVSADGAGKVLRNDFPKSKQAVDAARAAMSDLQAAGGASVQTNNLETKDLTSGGGPKLVTGSQCAAAIAAVMCIVSAMCGLGGESGAHVLAATVEAGVSKECE